MYRDPTPEEEARIILMETTCALCPNKINNAAYGIILDKAAIKALIEKNPDATVLEGPDGLFMLAHLSCYEAVKLIHGGSRGS